MCHLSEESVAQEEEVVEITPGLNVELDETGNLIGIEVLRASAVLGDAAKRMIKKIEAA